MPKSALMAGQREAAAMKQSQRIVKNILAGAVGVGLGGLLQLGAIVFIARSVGVTQFGIYSFILAFSMFFQLLADSGLSNILVRELATKPERMGEILGAAMLLIWALSFAVGALFLAVIPFLHFSLEVKVLTALMGVATLAQFHASGYGAVLRSQEDNELHSLGFLLHKVIFCICVFAGLKSGLGLLGVVLAHLIPNIFQREFYKYLVLHFYTRPKLSRDYAEWKYLLTHSLPVGGATMLRLLSQQIDVVILTWLTNLQTVGLFSGPYRISMALRFIPQTMSIPLYPLYSRLAIQPEAKPQLQAAYEQSVKFFLVSGCAVATVFVTCAAPLITLLLGAKYQAAAPAMQILGAAFVPFFVSNPLPLLLTALHDQRFLLWATIASLVSRVVLNFALIPPLGFIGPSLAFLGGELVIIVVMMARLRSIGYPLAIFGVVWRPLIASAVMGLILVLTCGNSLIWSLPWVVVACAVYVALIFKLGTFSADELEVAREGLGFVRPLLARWSNWLKETVP
jgi:O-antigen/teichoic acid export membrane protein